MINPQCLLGIFHLDNSYQYAFYAIFFLVFIAHLKHTSQSKYISITSLSILSHQYSNFFFSSIVRLIYKEILILNRSCKLFPLLLTFLDKLTRLLLLPPLYHHLLQFLGSPKQHFNLLIILLSNLYFVSFPFHYYLPKNFYNQFYLCHNWILSA